MLQPKRTKFRKQFKGRIHGEAKGGFNLNFGSFIAASRSASLATGSATPSISNMMRPGFTLAAQYSTEPLPLP